MTLAHLSDVHFGREEPEMVRALLEELERIRPDVIVVSGDLTQRAKKRQFRAARAFLDALPAAPLLVVPGNHDISATDLWQRTVRPFARYRRFITRDLAPSYLDRRVAIAGVNTVRVLARKDGRINLRQAAVACAQLDCGGPEALRIVVTHHPMDRPETNKKTDRRHATVVRAPLAMRLFARSGADLFLSGHLHGGLSFTTSARYPFAGWNAVVAHAGTAVSTRTRDGEPNSWNLIRGDRHALAIERMVWGGERFRAEGANAYARGPEGWQLQSGSAEFAPARDLDDARKR